MAAQPFLTELDPRGGIKGSRDPLGLMSIWTRLGRRVVGNLTTVSTSLSGFVTLLVGHHFVMRLAEEGTGGGDLAVFLKWEQLVAYARGLVNEDWDFRGKERARQFVASSKLRLGTDPELQLLGNQKIYGLWGLYTNPSRASGLLAGDPSRLTAAPRRLMEEVYLPTLARAGCRRGDAIAALLREPSPSLSSGAEHPVLRAVAKLFPAKLSLAEQEVFREHLLRGGPDDSTRGLQAVLVDLLVPTLAEAEWAFTPTRIRQLAKQARLRGERGVQLAEQLERIRGCEMLFGPAGVVFDDVLHAEGQTLDELAARLRQQWGATVPHLELDTIAACVGDLRDPSGDSASGQRWVQLARAWREGDYAQGYKILLQQNAAVMRARANAAPWVELRGEQRIHVNYKEESAPVIPTAEQLPEFWWHPYFLASLRQVAQALNG